MFATNLIHRLHCFIDKYIRYILTDRSKGSLDGVVADYIRYTVTAAGDAVVRHVENLLSVKVLTD